MPGRVPCGSTCPSMFSFPTTSSLRRWSSPRELEQRERVKAKLERALATEFPNVVGRVYPLELGPPVGWPVQYRVSGPEPDQVRAIAFKVAQEIGSAPGTENVNYNWMEPARTIRIRVDQDQARLLGLSSQQLALSLNAVVSGVTATQMRSGIHLVDVLVRASAEQRMSLSTIRTLQVPLPNGRTVPLSQIATVDYDQEYPIVWRRDRRPTVTVQADLVPGMQAATVVQELAPKIAALNAALPSGYHIDVGGTVEESSKAQNSVVAVLPLMLILILTVLMLQLQSFSRLFLVLSVAPLGLLGVVAALLVADKPLGFVAILGVLALTGMIARNSVILIDQVESEKAQGRDAWDAVVDATMHRFRPDPADRCRGNPRHGPDRADRVLGADGLRDHGRPGGRDGSDARVPAGALCGLVPDQAARTRGHPRTSLSRTPPCPLLDCSGRRLWSSIQLYSARYRCSWGRWWEVAPRCSAPSTRNGANTAFSGSHPRSRNGRPFMPIS